MIKKISFIFNVQQKIRLVILFLMIFIGSFVELLGVSAILPLVSAVADPEIIYTNNRYIMLGRLLGAKDIRIFILYTAIILVGIYIFKNTYITCMYDVTYRFTYNNQRRLATRLMKCYMNQDYLFHTSHNVSELMRNISSDVTGFFNVVLSFLQLITEAAVCGVLIVFLLIQDVKTTLMLVVLLSIFLFIVMVVFKKKLKRMGQRSREISAEQNKYMLQAFGAIKEIKVAGNEDFFVNKYDECYEENALIQQRQQLLNIVPRPIMETVCICGLLLFMSLQIYFGADMAKFIPTMSVFAVSAVRMLPSFNRISGYIGNITFSLPSVDAVYNDLKEAEALEGIKKETHDEEATIDPDATISVRDLEFAYPSRPDKRIFDGVSLEIPARKSVAFIGPSGAGKTTLADVILGVLKPDKGAVYIGEADVYRNLGLWHQCVGYIPQTIYLIDDTVRANVAFGI